MRSSVAPARTPVDLFSLQIFADVARMGSVSQAARAHGLSQPSVSQRMSLLERAVGMVLMERRTTGVRLTEQGLQVLERAQHLLAEQQAFHLAIEEIRLSAGVRLHLSASYTLAEHLLPGWLEPFHRVHSGVDVELEVGNSERVIRRVRERRAELGFVEGPQIPLDLERVTVASDELAVVVAPGHPWSRRRSRVPLALALATPMVLRERGSGTRQAFELAVSRASSGEMPLVALELGSSAAVKAAVMEGIGPGVVSALAVEAEVAAGALIVVHVEGLAMHRKLLAVWPLGVSLSPEARALLSVIGVAN